MPNRPSEKQFQQLETGSSLHLLPKSVSFSVGSIPAAVLEWWMKRPPRNEKLKILDPPAEELRGTVGSLPGIYELFLALPKLHAFEICVGKGKFKFNLIMSTTFVLDKS